MSQYLYRIVVFNKKKVSPLSIVSFYSGEAQVDSSRDKRYEPNSETNVLWNSIITPNEESQFFEHLPIYLKIKSKKKDLLSNTRNILWSNIDKRETREDSQFARLIEVAIPHFFSKEEAQESLSKFSAVLASEGMIIDASLHKMEDGVVDVSKNDYSGYMLCSLRNLNYGSFVQKNREWNSADKMILWRQVWLEILVEKIYNKEIDEKDKKNWIDKLKIYPSIKSKLKM